MNIFILSEDPVEAAQMQCDKHVVKMIVESAQMLCTVGKGAYKPTHVNHPCTVWASRSKENFEWLYNHAIALCHEYTKRYGRRHKTQDVIEQIQYPKTFPVTGLTPFVLAMPDEFKIGDAVQSYRAYYHSKASFARWSYSVIPQWWNPI